MRYNIYMCIICISKLSKSVCIHKCRYIFYIYLYVCACTYTWNNKHLFLCMCFIYVSIYIYVYTYIQMYILRQVHPYRQVFISINKICLQLYIYIKRHKHYCFKEILKKDCSKIVATYNLHKRDFLSLYTLSDSDSHDILKTGNSDEVQQQIYHTHLQMLEPELRAAD